VKPCAGSSSRRKNFSSGWTPLTARTVGRAAAYLDHYPWNKSGDKVFWPYSGKPAVSGGDLENMRSLYKAEVSQTDFWVGQLLAHLRKNNLLETRR